MLTIYYYYIWEGIRVRPSTWSEDVWVTVGRTNWYGFSRVAEEIGLKLVRMKDLDHRYQSGESQPEL